MNPPSPPSIPPAGATETDSERIFWLPWLRIMLYVNLALAIADVLRVFAPLQFFFKEIMNAKASGQMLMTPTVLWNLITWFALPVFYLVVVIGSIRFNSTSRKLLVIYSWIAMGVSLFQLIGFFWRNRFYAGEWFIHEATSQFEHSVYGAAVPLLTVLFLTRPQIRALFVHRVEGFDVIEPMKPAD